MSIEIDGRDSTVTLNGREVINMFDEYGEETFDPMICVEVTLGDVVEGEDVPITMVYTNWKGVTSVRHIYPHEIYFGFTEYHPEPQWLMDAYDCDKADNRTFALRDCDFKSTN